LAIHVGLGHHNCEKKQLLPHRPGTFCDSQASNELPDDYAFLVATPCGKKGHNTAGFLATRPRCIPCTLDIAHHSLWLRNEFASFKEETALIEKRSVK
jgi:hypothetical protein